MPRCLIGLGSNLGDRAATLSKAVEALRAEPSLQIIAVSRWHETAAVGGPVGQEAFLNGALTLETKLPPGELLTLLQRIECWLGRVREVHWGARTMDLDLLLYGEEQVDTPALLVPHRWMALRRFVLAPAAEIAGELRHPRIGWTVAELLANLNRRPRYIAIAGPPGSDKTRLARELSAAVHGRWIADPALVPRETGPETDSAIHDLHRHVEFLFPRRAALDAAAWPVDENWTVSDFAWREALAYAEISLSVESCRQFEQRWRAASAGVAVQTATLLLAGPSQESHDPIEQAWGSRIDCPGTGPVLRLTDDFDQALREARAAVAGMI